MPSGDHASAYTECSMAGIGGEQVATAGIPDLYCLISIKTRPEASCVPSGDHASANTRVGMAGIGVEQAAHCWHPRPARSDHQNQRRGVYHQETTPVRSLVSMAGIGGEQAALLASQTCTVLSKEPEARRVPSGDHASAIHWSMAV